MTRRILAFITALLVSGAAVWGQVTITPPTIANDPLGVNKVIATAVEEMQKKVNAEIERYTSQPRLARAVANTGAATAHIGSQRTYLDYRTFAAVFGFGTTISAPGLTTGVVQKAQTTLQNEGDLYAMLAIQPAASLGIRLGVFSDKLDRWYVSAKFGMLKLSEEQLRAFAPGLSYDSLTVGALVNYQLLGTRRLPLGFLRWRGLSLGSGLVYQQNTATFRLKFGDVNQSFNFGGSTRRVTLKPEISAIAASNSVVIPLEANTGVRILWLLDLSLGAGVDLTFGGSKVDLKIGSPVKLDSRLGALGRITDGSVAVSAGSKDQRPTILRPRLSAAVAFNLGPVKLDVPAMLYFEPDGNTAVFGINLGLVW